MSSFNNESSDDEEEEEEGFDFEQHGSIATGLDWVLGAAKSVASDAVGVFQCAADNTTTNAEMTITDETTATLDSDYNVRAGHFSGRDPSLSTTMSTVSALGTGRRSRIRSRSTSTTMDLEEESNNSNITEIKPYLLRDMELPPDTSNEISSSTRKLRLPIPEPIPELKPDLERPAMMMEVEGDYSSNDCISVLTPISNIPKSFPLSAEEMSSGSKVVTREDLHAGGNHHHQPTVLFDDGIVGEKASYASDDKKKRRIIVGATILIVSVIAAVAAGLVLPQALKRTSASSEQNKFSSTIGGTENVDNLGISSRVPLTSSPTYAPNEDKEATSFDNTIDESQSTTLSAVQPAQPDTQNPSSTDINVSMTIAQTIPSTTAPSITAASSENQTTPSSTSTSFEGLLSEENFPPNAAPTTASPTGNRVSTNLAPAEANAVSTGSSSLRPATTFPTSSAPTIRPSLRPSTENPTISTPTTGPSVRPVSVQPTKFPSTKSPNTDQPTTAKPTRSFESLWSLTPEPSQSTESLIPAPPISVAVPAAGTQDSTPSSTSLVPVTGEPTGFIFLQPAKGSTTNDNPFGTTESRLTIDLQTDEHGHETSWTLYSVDAETDTQTTRVSSLEENTYAPYEQDSVELFLPPGKYRFTLRDTYGDGFCCSNGSEGWYAISVDDRELIRGGYYRSEIAHDILIGYDPDMSDRDEEWLEAHNSRRKIWHERHGETYVPLRWSKRLAEDAFSWAQALLSDCDVVGISHESGVDEGENLAKNKGGTELGMGQLYPPENILRRWVDQEETWGYPRNMHLTQALWRASRYLGCGDAVRNYDDGAICRVQVCRYVRAGNCAMGSYNANEGDNWLVPMLMEQTACGPQCPSEGCF